jgi:hypothetical protein
VDGVTGPPLLLHFLAKSIAAAGYHPFGWCWAAERLG